MILMRNADVDTIRVEAIEGQAIYGGDLLVKPMMDGDEMVVMEIHYAAGVGAPAHVHSHESVTYVVRGKVKMTVGEQSYVLGPGDVCRHPAGVPHGVEAIEESVMLEVKAPAPEMASFFRMSAKPSAL